MTLKRKFETKEHVVTEQVLVEEKLICDICEHEIKRRRGYWHVTTHHSDWGNDSCESYEEFDVCSVDCLKDKFNDYCEESFGDIGTKCIDVEHRTYC